MTRAKGNDRRLPVEHGQPPKLPPRARRNGSPLDLSRKAEVTLVVRSRGSDEEWAKLVAELTSGPPAKRRYLSRAELAKQWSAAPADMAALRRFATAHGLTVVASDPVRRCMVLSGSLRRLGTSFGVEFFTVDHPLGPFRSHHGAPRVPESIHPLIEGVFGLDTRSGARPHASPAPRPGGMDRNALLRAYRIPAHLSGKGQCVAVIALGGGFHQRDVNAYFNQLGLTPPRIRRRGVAGARNHPAPMALLRKYFEEGRTAAAKKPVKLFSPAEFNWIEWTIETTMDLDMIGTIAPEASILLVQSTDTSQGQYHAVTSVVTDAKNAPSVLACSWGDPESRQSAALMRTLNWWFQAAAVLGMTVCVSSGDQGDGATPRQPNTFTAQFPATSPWVLACGGTTLDPRAGTEVAWEQMGELGPMASGGGFSSFFPLPPFQQAAGIDPRKWIPSGGQSGHGRAIPDVAAKANLAPAYSVIVGGNDVPAGGTSAAAPLWAGVIALLNEGLHARLGSLHASLYAGPLRKALRDITAGSTGVYHACKGWDACTGWGSPNGEAMLRTLRGAV